MSISSLILHVRPEKAQAVEAAIAGLAGVELHATTEDGRMIVTVDHPDNRVASDTLARFQGLEGVLNTALVYNYFEDDSDREEEAHESLKA